MAGLDVKVEPGQQLKAEDQQSNGKKNMNATQLFDNADQI